MAQDDIWGSIDEEDLIDEEVDQKELQVIKIKARNKRIMDKAAGIVIPAEPIDQMPVNKSKLKQQAPRKNDDWSPYD